MRYSRYALAVSGLMLANASASFGQVPTPPPPPPAPEPAAAPAPASSIPPPSVAPFPAPVASATPAPSVPYGAGMRVNLSPDGSKYLRFLSWHQVWTRYTQNNENTLRAPGKLQNDQVDFALRRSRLIVLAQLNSRFLIYTHIGINNQTAVSGGFAPAVDGKKPQLFIH